MKALKFTAIAVVAAAAVSLVVVSLSGCGKTKESSQGTQQKVEAGVASKVPGQAAEVVLANPKPGYCPVSGEAIDGKTFVTIEGKTYGLCCADCIAKIKANPEKYIGPDASPEGMMEGMGSHQSGHRD